MLSPAESRAALELVTSRSVADGLEIANRTTGDPVARRLVLLETVPGLITYYGEAAATLAADLWDEERAAANVVTAFTAATVVLDRVVKIRRGIAWAAEPWFTGTGNPSGRLAEVIQLETAKSYRETILQNRRNDPAAAGWKRVTSGKACKMCRMLADRGAVYKAATARFATHPKCHCTATPVFQGGRTGEEASVMQYTASKRKRSPQQQAQLREYLNKYY